MKFKFEEFHKKYFSCLPDLAAQKIGKKHSNVTFNAKHFYRKNFRHHNLINYIVFLLFCSVSRYCSLQHVWHAVQMATEPRQRNASSLK